MNKFNLILGTMTFGAEVDEMQSYNMVQQFIDAGYREIDTAYVYNNGKTEKILGSVFKDLKENSFTVSTKIHPRITNRLDSKTVKKQFERSLNRMERDYVDILYFHFPDSKTPVEEPLEVVADFYLQGRIKELGLSNFPANMVFDIWQLCKKNGWPLPTVYQGMYNILSRKVEDELIPTLRKLGIRFYAFNPLAGGLLTGKYTNYDCIPKSSRFSRLDVYSDRYWKKSLFGAVIKVVAKCREFDMNPTECAYRWLAFHSSLNQQYGDGIVMGATNTIQLSNNMNALENGILPGDIVNAFNNVWENIKEESPEYYKLY